MKKILIVVVVVLLIGIGAAIVFAQGESSPTESNITTSNSGDSSSNSTSDTKAEKVITAEEVAKRNTSANCWSIINGGVYDLTSYIAQHPGGNDITLACGVDGSNLFNERQASDGTAVGSGSPHSDRAGTQLQQLRIGTIQ